MAAFNDSGVSINFFITVYSPTRLKLIGLGTSGDVEVLNQIDISGTVAEVIAAYNSGVTFDVADIDPVTPADLAKRKLSTCDNCKLSIEPDGIASLRTPDFSISL